MLRFIQKEYFKDWTKIKVVESSSSGDVLKSQEQTFESRHRNWIWVHSMLCDLFLGILKTIYFWNSPNKLLPRFSWIKVVVFLVTLIFHVALDPIHPTEPNFLILIFNSIESIFYQFIHISFSHRFNHHT